MNREEENNLQLVANTIRGLSMDAIEAANSGHPGLPLGCAEIAAFLFAKWLKYDPQHPDWINRDRFVLSAGHGSMLLYSALHLAGYLPLEELKNFRKFNSKCPGHPEYKLVPGVEATTGPLGQGIGMGVGMALANKLMAAQFNLQNTNLLDSTVYILAGDGCLLEGISNEASSLAGHLGLDNVVLIYDSNDICLDGPTSECMTENVQLRYTALGWNTITINGHNFKEIADAFSQTKNRNGKPTIIIAKTTIGKGAPNVQGTSEVHGKAMGAEEVRLTKKAYEIPLEPLFYLPETVVNYFSEHQKEQNKKFLSWSEDFKKWQNSNPEKVLVWNDFLKKEIPAAFKEELKVLKVGENKATRNISGEIIQLLHDKLPFVYGGSADLSCSDNTAMKKSSNITVNNFRGRNLKFGAREFGMGTLINGMALQGMVLPFCGTFLVFSDYMRAAIRLAALMKIQVVYQFTHDSFFVGEDGPTHHPVEHLASLRAIPDLHVIRPADANEVKGAWLSALAYQGPTAIILTRQGIKPLANSSIDNVSKGGYIIKKEVKDKIDFCILASGSEVATALEVAAKLTEQEKSVRVVSIPSFELFDQQTEQYMDEVLGKNVQRYCVIEAGTSFGWTKYCNRNTTMITLDHFSKSAPVADLKEDFGFSVEKIINKLI